MRNLFAALRAPFSRLASRMRDFAKRLAANDATKRIIGFGLAGIALLVLILGVINFAWGELANSGLLSGKTYRIDASGPARGDLDPLLVRYRKLNPSFKYEYVTSKPDVFVGSARKNGPDATRIQLVPPLEIKAGATTRILREGRYYWFAGRRKGFIVKPEDQGIAGLQSFLESYFKDGTPVTLNVLGDIIPGRHVAQRIAERGVSYPVKRIAPLVRGADVVFGDLEAPLSDRFTPPQEGTNFIAPKKTVEAIKMLGINVVALANNHSTNFGRDAFVDTIHLLKSNGIKYAGGGVNITEAHAPAILNVRGTRIAFVEYNSISGSIDATSDKPGVAWISMPPWYPENEQQIQTALTDIAAARKRADVVIAGFHWSQEDVYYPSPSMTSLAHRACDAGADMVIGSHPHTIQPMEFYRGKLIAYSLGNFIFDQMQRDQTRDGFFMKCRFNGNYLTGLELVPYKIYDYSQPRPFAGNSGQYLLDHVFSLSGW